MAGEALTFAKGMVHLPFLRPLALPRAVTVQRFLSASTSSNSRSPISHEQTQSKSPSPKSASSPAIFNLPYRIERTASSNLPVYISTKSGGTRKETRLRKIEGDIDTLKEHLRDMLKINDKDIVINRLTKHIVIKGWMKPAIERFLEERKF